MGIIAFSYYKRKRVIVDRHSFEDDNPIGNTSGFVGWLGRCDRRA
jgi:hypothetical protein